MIIFEECESRDIKRDRDQCCKRATLNPTFLNCQTLFAREFQIAFFAVKFNVCCN